jgi:hemoglobin-like flavoprotein
MPDNDSPLDPTQRQLVEDGWRALEPRFNEFAEFFYNRLFELDPQMRNLFDQTNMHQQGKKLTDTLTIVVKGLAHFEMLRPAMGELGNRHAGYGVGDAHYDTVRDALLGALADELSDGFTADSREAWISTYDAVAEIMKGGL